VKSGDMKRLGFLLGLILLFAGFILLNDPMAVEERNCGSALMRKPVDERRYEVRCDAKLDRRRWPGFIMFGTGAVLVIRIRPGVLLAPD
jgi:hypothetical protein